VKTLGYFERRRFNRRQAIQERKGSVDLCADGEGGSWRPRSLLTGRFIAAQTSVFLRASDDGRLISSIRRFRRAFCML